MRYAILVLALSCAHVSNLPPVPRTLPQADAAAITVISLCTDKDPFTGEAPEGIRSWMGSGVIVDDRHALTALHVVDCPAMHAVRIQMANGRRLRMLVDRIDRQRDIARMVIMSDETFGLGAGVEIGTPEKGAKVCKVSMVPERVTHCGTIRSDWSVGFDFTMPTVAGNSGSGVYQDGRLIGIVTRRNTGETGGGMASPITERVR